MTQLQDHFHEVIIFIPFHQTGLSLKVFPVTFPFTVFLFTSLSLHALCLKVK